MKATLPVIAATAIAVAPSLGCSLKYSEGAGDEAEGKVPEFVFNGASLSRFENGGETLSLKADRIEQYKGGTRTFARNIKFSTKNSKGEAETDGECGLLSADSDAESYILFDGIKIDSRARDVKITAGELKWNGKSEQLTSAVNDTIKIEKEGTTIYGSGFSASAVSDTFTFSGAVSGEVVTDDDEEASDGGAESAGVGDGEEIADEGDGEANPGGGVAAEGAP